jgi:hypothetical protein
MESGKLRGLLLLKSCVCTICWVVTNAREFETSVRGVMVVVGYGEVLVGEPNVVGYGWVLVGEPNVVGDGGVLVGEPVVGDGGVLVGELNVVVGDDCEEEEDAEEATAAISGKIHESFAHCDCLSV